MLLDYLRRRGVIVIEEKPQREPEYPYLTVKQLGKFTIESCYKISPSMFATSPFSEESFETEMEKMIREMAPYEEIIGTLTNPITVYAPNSLPTAFLKLADKIK